MSRYKIQVVLLDEALTFVRSLPLKVQQKITYNYKKIEHGIVDKELFKKLENSEIWEFRTLFNGNCYHYGDRRNRRRDGQGQKRDIDRFSMFKDRKSTV